MAEDWLMDVRKYAPDADENVVQAIVRYCGIALQSRDGQLVAMSDKKERETVRENYLKKKLGLTRSDAELDEGVLAIGQRMKEDRTKNRVTVYYLLAEYFGSLNIFGGVAGAAGAAGLAAAAGLGAGPRDDDSEGASAAPLAAAGLGAAATGAAAAAMPDPEPVMAAAPVPPPPPVAPEPAPSAEPAYAADYGGDDTGGGMGWLKWLLLAALLAALVFFLLRFCAPQESTPVPDATGTEATGGETADADPAAATETATPDTATDAAAAAAVPTGSGVVAGERSGKPMLTVYFDSGKADISKDFATVATVIKDYAAKNPGAKFAVSGFNDPTGNAAFNAELSKRRAQAVGKSLEGLGIAATSIELVKPEATTDQTVDKATARRVEVTVQ